MRARTIVRLAAVGAIVCVGVLGTSATASASAQKLPATAFNPALTGPPPPAVVISPNCPAFLSSDAWNLNFVSGNAVSYGVMNKNGDWGGGNAEGIGVLSMSDSTPVYTGHLHLWFGGGQNSLSGANQTENGFTVTYQGSGPSGTISIHANIHQTTNNSGTPTANVFNASASCSP